MKWNQYDIVLLICTESILIKINLNGQQKDPRQLPFKPFNLDITLTKGEKHSASRMNKCMLIVGPVLLEKNLNLWLMKHLG